MSHPIIQFTDLNDLIKELFDCNVRVNVLEISKSLSSQMPLRQVTIGVHIRAISIEGHLLGCHLPVGRLQLYNGRRDGDPTWTEYDRLWGEAEELLKRVVTHLESIAFQEGLTVHKAGIIDFGQTQIINGRWDEPADENRS